MPASAYPDLKYIEGSIKEFPAVLKQQIIPYNGEDFARSNWKPEDARPQCLDRYRDGCPTEFVCRDDQAMTKLSAGRFRWRNVKHIVVIGLPDTRGESGLRYVIATLPEKSWDLFSVMTSRPGNWKGSIWNIWKPEGLDGGYYEDVPDTILRVKDMGSGVGRFNTKVSVPAHTAVSMLNPRTQSVSPQDPPPLKQQTALPIMNSTTTKRKLPLGTSFDYPKRPKKPYEGNRLHERPTSTASTSAILAATIALSETQEPLSVSNDLPLTNQLKAPKRGFAYHPASKGCQGSEGASAQAKRSAQLSTSRDIEHTSPLPPHEDSIRGFDTVATAVVSVKEEIVNTDSPTSPQATPFGGDSSSTAARSVPRGGKIKLVLKKALTGKKLPAVSSPFISDECSQTALEGLQSSASTDTLIRDETHNSNSRNPEHASTLPPQTQPLHDGNGANTALTAVKQEVVDTVSFSSSQTSHSAAGAWSPTTFSQAYIDNSGSVSAFTKYPVAKGTLAVKSASSCNSSHQTGATEVIEITDSDDDHCHDKIQQISDRQISVSFIDEYGKEQHTILFEKCNTAEDLFEEACVWDIADKETKMLEIKIPGCKPARIRKNNEENFTQKIIRPLREISSSAGEGQAITLTVQKYM